MQFKKTLFNSDVKYKLNYKVCSNYTAHEVSIYTSERKKEVDEMSDVILITWINFIKNNILYCIKYIMQ